MSRKTILFISVNDRCYASYRFFAARLAEAVEKRAFRQIGVICLREAEKIWNHGIGYCRRFWEKRILR